MFGKKTKRNMMKHGKYMYVISIIFIILGIILISRDLINLRDQSGNCCTCLDEPGSDVCCDCSHPYLNK